MALAELAVAQRQVAVALDALLEDQDVARAVHRLQARIRASPLSVVNMFSRYLSQWPVFSHRRLVEDLRALDLLVAVVAVDLAHVLLHALPHRPALGVPEHQAGRMVVDVEQVQLAAQLAVVALFGLFQHGQVLLQLVLGGPGRAVDALQHLVAVVAAPVGAGQLHQLEVLELAGAGHVRAAAQVFELAFAVQRHVFIGRNAGNDLGLVVLAQALEIRHGLVARQHAAQSPARPWRPVRPSSSRWPPGLRA